MEAFVARADGVACRDCVNVAGDKEMVMGDSRSDRHNQVFKLAERFTKIFESSLLKESQAERDELETLRAQIEALGYSLAFVQINDTNGKCLKLKLAVMSNERTTTTH